MKVLIYIGCYLVLAVIEGVIVSSGIMLGAIPTVILFIGAGGVAKWLCSRWDNREKR